MLLFTVEPGNAKYLSLKLTHQISDFSKALDEFIQNRFGTIWSMSFLVKATPFHFCLNAATFEKLSSGLVII